MNLLRPYDDEVVGSALSRALRETGLGVPALLEALTGQALFNHSFLVARRPVIAQAFGMDVAEFVRRHTAVAYAVAFMPHQQRCLHWNSAVSTEQKASLMAGVLRNLTSTNPNLRFCPGCVSDELERFGEAYWHRVHQLPAVTMCVIHERPLHVSPISIRARLPARPPHECDGI